MGPGRAPRIPYKQKPSQLSLRGQQALPRGKKRK
jgi:hypothetical protein